MSKSFLMLSLVIVVLTTALILWWGSAGDQGGLPASSNTTVSRARPSQPIPEHPAFATLVGAVDPVVQAAQESATEAQVAAAQQAVGTLPRIAPDANEHAKSITKAFDEGRSYELSASRMPEPFDAAAYAKDPQSYLTRVIPGRVWQVLRPGEGVPALQPASAIRQDMKQGESVELAVQAVPNQPVTFTSFDCGSFPNGFPSQTIQADEKGRAAIKLTATRGMIAQVNILAGCPMASGQVLFRLHVDVPPAAEFVKTASVEAPK